MRNKKKYGSKFGTVTGLIMAALLILGIFFMFASKTSGETPLSPRSWRLNTGMVLFGLTFVMAAIFPFLPAKLRGVEEVSLKIKVIQCIISISVLFMVGGFAWVIYSIMQDPDNKQNFSALIGAGVFVLGFAMAWIAASIRDKKVERGEVPPDVTTIMRAESDIHESEFGMDILKKLTGNENVLSPEERERELRRIEEQDRQAGVVPMTKEQVEEYEKRKRF
ncbi:MAG: hypothetical protein K2N56_09500 [Oscillospiraceae bacterium]|nr:hypothetical protein [Oscillospiraceae bacterium]